MLQESETPPEPEYEYHDIMSDSFYDEEIDGGTWIVHGEGVSTTYSRLHIDSFEPWGENAGAKLLA